MKRLVQEKEKAAALRRKGLSYKEILNEVPVAKSSLSLWLKDFPLTKDEKKILKERTDSNISKGRIRAASELRKRRLDREDLWFQQARDIFIKHRNEPLFHTGIALYWAEGAKRDTQWSFINTDVDMINLMKRWLGIYMDVSDEEVTFRLFIHKSYADGSCEKWWQTKLQCGDEKFLKTVYKISKHTYKFIPGHYGCLRIEVKNSKHLLSKMGFLRKLMVESYRNR